MSLNFVACVVHGLFYLLENAVFKKKTTLFQVYTAYRFHVRACTAVGCSDSETVRISTSQLPPSHVATPRLLVMGGKNLLIPSKNFCLHIACISDICKNFAHFLSGTDRIRADWEHPNQLNGVLERYLLYASTEAGALGDVTYNNTDLFLYYVMEELLAGTTYYITVGVRMICGFEICRIIVV